MIRTTGKTQNEIILEHLRRYTTITPLEAITQYGIYRLSSVIERLRKRGWAITTQMKVAPSGSEYGEYRLHLAHFEKQTVRIPATSDAAAGVPAN